MLNSYPTIKQLKEMKLSDYQIKILANYANCKHGFFNYLNKIYDDYSIPNSIFFLDIKDTLYHSKGHGSNGVLGRAGDSLPIDIKDIRSLGLLLDHSVGQPFTMDLYELSENHSAKIEYDFPEDTKDEFYKMDIPTKSIGDNGYAISGFPMPNIDYSSTGPFKLVFISTYDIDTQKKIITFYI